MGQPDLKIRPAAAEDAKVVHEILHQAARWLEETGRPMWRTGELSEKNISSEIDRFFVVELENEIIGTFKIDREDLLFWPDHPEPAAVYLHRIAIRRSFAGRGIPQVMLTWAVDHARSLGKKFLRLDCEANRPKLRLLYESFGFAYHSDKEVGPYLVARYEYTLPT